MHFSSSTALAAALCLVKVVVAAPQATTTASAAASSTTTYVAAGGSAAGDGLDTSLYTATTTWSTTASASTSTVISTYTSANASTTVTSTVSSTVTTAASQASGDFTDWSVFIGNGVNLGNWLEIEESNDEYFFTQHAPNATDEWTFCETLGSQCGPVMEEHYATYITTESIDKLASVGVNILRIPTTYAAWISVPGSQLYHGDQQTYLQTITQYAIETYGMRVIIGLHSLPGGVNDLDIGEASGHDAWFQNETNLEYSYTAVSEVLSFIQDSGNPWAFTLAPINEASDNITGFATATTLTSAGSDWIVKYINGVLDLVAGVDSRIPVQLQDCFKGEEFWSPYFEAFDATGTNGTNLVIDTHIYYFAAAGIYSEYVNPAICGQAEVAGGDNKFPVFIGEWSLQVLYNNSYDARQDIFNTQRYAWSTYAHGGAFWSANFNGTAAVDGEGDQSDYWDYLGLIDAGVITSVDVNATYC